MADNRTRLQEAARNSVQRRGLKDLSFRTLADEIGIKSSSVHYYFPEKADLARVLIERYSESVFEKLEVIAARNVTLKRKLAEFIAIFENVANEEQLCLCGMMAAEIELLDDSNKQRLAQFFSRMENWLTALLLEHKDEMDIPISASKLSQAVVAGLEGALLIDRVVGSHKRLKSQKDLLMALVS